ncbi:MAG: formylglycine-generating enzyme family protein [Bacteroidales bacterium]|nr:formylglycine-generating enzyme family protein [Bacteroidales bacterium]
MIKSTLKRFTAVLVLLLTVSIVFAIVPDPKTKKKVTTTTTTTTTTKSGGTQKKPAATPKKSSSISKNNTTTQKGSSSSHKSSSEKEPQTNYYSGGKASNSSSYSYGGETVIRVGSVTFRMIRVDGGTFTMGATSEQGSDADSDETPAHSVTLSTYYIGETEVTQELWQEVMGSNPSYFKGSRRPVEKVSWEDCQDFIRRLNQRTGKNFRLPTEAEWEYAARGGRKSYGSKYAGGSSVDDVAWYWVNSGDSRLSGSWDWDRIKANNCQTHPVATKRANELGLYDMSGNVWEWCQDWYGNYSSSSQTNPQGPSSGSYRVYRGGCWRIIAGSCRVSFRRSGAPSFRYHILGLRLAL